MVWVAQAIIIKAQRLPRKINFASDAPDRTVVSPLPTPVAPTSPDKRSQRLLCRVWPEALGLYPLIALVTLVTLAAPFGAGLDAIGATTSMRPERLFVLLACAGAVYATKRAERAGAKLGAFTALRTIGLLSFIICLIHVLALQIVGNIPLPGVFGTEPDRYVAMFSLGLVLSLSIYIVVHRTIEYPPMRLNAQAMNRPAYSNEISILVLLINANLFSYAAWG